jgi:hypothetical protein
LATEAALKTLVAALLAAIPEAIPAAPVEVDWAVVMQVLDDLEPLLATSSMKANILFEANTPLLKTALGILGDGLEQQIGHFLYPEALATLRQARAEYASIRGNNRVR